MKYGLFFLLFSTALSWFAYDFGGFSWILIWPAISFLLVAVAYFFEAARLLGKQSGGSIHPLARAALLPYHFLVSAIWNGIRLVSSEPAFNEVSSHRHCRLIVGRRLSVREFQELDRQFSVDTIVDLTSELSEPYPVTVEKNYLSVPVLDASVPSHEQVEFVMQELAKRDDQTVYIHCAQGHGRTGLMAALFLICQNHELNSTDAIEILKRARPLLDCNKKQVAYLRRYERDRK